MDRLNDFLKQITSYISTNNGNVQLPYKTNFSFLSKYPYEIIKVAIPKWTRIDGLSQQISGISNGWKLICIFNDIVSPMELLNRDYIYLPSDFNLAISWLTQQNTRRLGE